MGSQDGSFLPWPTEGCEHAWWASGLGVKPSSCIKYLLKLIRTQCTIKSLSSYWNALGYRSPPPPPWILSKRNSQHSESIGKIRWGFRRRECGIPGWEEGRWFRTVTGEDSNVWNEGHPGPKWECGFWQSGKWADAYIFKNDNTLDLKIWGMALFKSDLHPIYISEQTAYCFHQGEISTHVYLMFPSKYLHFKAFWALSFRTVQNVAPGLLPDGPCYSRRPYHPARMAPNKRTAPLLRPMTQAQGHCNWDQSWWPNERWESQAAQSHSFHDSTSLHLMGFFTRFVDCAGVHRSLGAWSHGEISQVRLGPNGQNINPSASGLGQKTSTQNFLPQNFYSFIQQTIMEGLLCAGLQLGTGAKRINITNGAYIH